MSTPVEAALARRALNRFKGRRLLEAGLYRDGGPLLMLVFSERPDQLRLPKRGGRVQWAVTTYEDWLLLSDEGILARSSDSDQMDVPGFEPVIGCELTGGDVRERDLMLSLTFSGGYSFIVLSPPARVLPEVAVRRWSITAPSSVVTLRGDRIITET